MKINIAKSKAGNTTIWLNDFHFKEFFKQLWQKLQRFRNRQRQGIPFIVPNLQSFFNNGHIYCVIVGFIIDVYQIHVPRIFRHSH